MKKMYLSYTTKSCITWIQINVFSKLALEVQVHGK